MPLEGFVHENFMEWPGAGEQVQLYSGTGWSLSSGAAGATVIADANFKSGKCISWDTTINGSSMLTFPGAVPTGVSWAFSWNQIRSQNSSVNPLDDQSSGIRFEYGVSDFWTRIVSGNGGVGMGNAYYLQQRSGLSGTFVTLAVTPNDFLLGAKYPMAIVCNRATGEIQWWVNNTLIYVGTIAAFAGLQIPAVRFGRLGSGLPGGGHHVSDLHLYTDSAYLGPTEIRGGFPTANDANQDWTFTGAASAWQCIDNVFSAAPTQYIDAAASGDISDFDCPVDNVGVFQIFSGEITSYVTRTGPGVVDMENRIGDGAGNFTNGPSFQPPSATYVRAPYYLGPVDPNTGFNWNPAALATNQIGFERTT